MRRYEGFTEEDLWHSLESFLHRVIPAAEEAGIRMAIHPDDPPWGIFGLPRIITCEENLDRFLSICDSPANGLTFCTGSLGASPGKRPAAPGAQIREAPSPSPTCATCCAPANASSARWPTPTACGSLGPLRHCEGPRGGRLRRLCPPGTTAA